MFGFVVGTLSLIGLMKVLSHGHHRRAYARCGGGSCYSGHHAWHGRGRYEDDAGPRERGGRRGFGRRMATRWLFERLDTTHGQEKVISAAIEEMEEVLKKHREDFDQSFADLGRAVTSPELDHSLIAEAWIKHDRAIEAIRLSVTTQLDQLHQALDERQRKILAELIESGPRWPRS